MKKKLLTAVLATAMCAVLLAGCGGSGGSDGSKDGGSAKGGETVDATYTAEYGVDETTEYGYLNGIERCKTNVTLELKSDGTYSLTKEMTLAEENENLEGAGGNATFTGTYSKSGDEVTLSKAETAEYMFDWAIMTSLQYAEDASEGSDDERALSMFNHWSLNTNGNDEQVVKVSDSDNTFAYTTEDVWDFAKEAGEDGSPVHSFSTGQPMPARFEAYLYDGGTAILIHGGFHEPVMGTWQEDGEGLDITIDGVDCKATKNDEGKLSFDYSYGMGQASGTATLIEQ